MSKVTESTADLIEGEKEYAKQSEKKEGDIDVCENETIIKTNNAKGQTFQSKPQELNVDDILPLIGQFAKMQIMLIVIFCLIIIPSTYQTLIMSFVGNSPSWKCVGSEQLGCNRTGEFSRGDVFFGARCVMNRSSWEFTKPRHFSIVTEWNLICDRVTHSFLANSALFIGWAFGAIVLGIVSDRYGRKVVLYPSWMAVIVLGFVSSFVENFWFFFVLRLLGGVFQGGIGLTLFVLATELVGPKYRSLAGTTIWVAFTLTLCFMGLQAWLVPNWRTLEIITTVPYIILLLTYKFVPESVRWLRLNGRQKEATEILRKVAKTNKKSWPNVALTTPPVSIQVKKASFLDIFRPRTMLVSTAVQCFAWFVNGMVYYGITLASDNLGGNQYRDFVLASLVEIPANVLVIYCSNRFGRKPSTIVSMTIGGLSCFAVAFIPAKDVSSALIATRVSLGMVGKLCITISFNVLYIWSVELYPTVIRSQGMGLLSVVSRCGAASAPWIGQFLDHIHPYLPFGLMASLTLASAFTCFLLKETQGMPTAETLSDSTAPKKPSEENVVMKEMAV